MGYVSIFYLIALTFINVALLRKKLIHPSIVLNLSFLLVISIACISVYFFDFYTISTETYSIVLTGCTFFSIGGWCTDYLFRNKIKYRLYSEVKKNLVKSLIIMTLVLFPVVYREFEALIPGVSFGVKILRIRELGLEEQIYSTLSNNIIVLASISYLIAMYAYSKKIISINWLLLSLVLFVFYNVLTGTRAPIIFLGVASVFIYLRESERQSISVLISLVLGIFISGGLIAIYMGKDGADRDLSFVQNIPYIIENYFSYTVQGIILFDNYVVNKFNIDPSWDFLSGIKGILNKFGAGFSLYSKHADFSNFSESRSGNVYTMFFSIYPNYGLIGTVIFFSFYGSLASFLFNSRGVISSVLVSYVCGALVIGIFNEQFFTNLIFTIKLTLVLLFLSLLSREYKC